MAARKSRPFARSHATQAANSVLSRMLSATTAGELSATGKRWWGASASLLGVLLVWSLLQPVDATSVFQGAAIPQNLGWLILATLTAAACIACGVRYEFSLRSWCLVSTGLIWLVVATVLAGGDNNPRVAWNGFWQVVALGACYFSASALLPGPKSRLAALHILLVGCVALSLQGLYQVFVEMPAERAQYLADPEAVLAQNPDLDLPAGSPMRKRFEDRLLYSSEPYATFALTNSLAVLLSGGLVILCGLGAAGWRRQPRIRSGTRGGFRQSSASDSSSGSLLRRWLPLVALSLAVLVIGVCWFLTRSRVAYVALGVGGLAWLFTGGKRLRSQWATASGAVDSVEACWLSQQLCGCGETIAWCSARHRRASVIAWSTGPQRSICSATMDCGESAWGTFRASIPFTNCLQPARSLPIRTIGCSTCVLRLSLPVGLLLIGWLGMRLLKIGNSAESENGREPLSAVDVLDAWSQRCLLWGAGLGGALCLGLLGLLSGLEVPVLAVLWLASAGLIALSQPLLRVNQATLRGTLRAGVLTMLTCLLASGSWQASGLAVPLLIGLAVSDEQHRYKTEQGRMMPLAIVAIPALGLLCFLVQCWHPTTTSWSLLQQAQSASSVRAQLALVEAAAAADRLDTEPLRWRAQMLEAEAARAASDQFVPLAEQSLNAFDAWLARDSTKYLNWELAGKQALELAGHAQRSGLEPKKWLDAALDYYEQAVARYPSSVGLRAN